MKKIIGYIVLILVAVLGIYYFFKTPTVNTAAMTPAQIALLTPAQIAALTPAQIAALTPAQQAALTPDQNAAITTAQVAALSPDQVKLKALKTAVDNMTDADKASVNTLAKQVYDDCTWFIFETSHAMGLYQNVMDLNDAQFYYLIRVAWFNYDTWQFASKLKAQNFGLIQAWFAHRGWTEAQAKAIQASIISRVNTTPATI